jgi:hypothetical protein
VTDLERIIWTLMSTDDYLVRTRSETQADLIYVHNDPPHPIIHIEMRLP